MDRKQYTMGAKTAGELRRLIRQDRAEPANTLRAVRQLNAPWTQLNHVVFVNTATPFFTCTAGKVYMGYWRRLDAVPAASGGLGDYVWTERENVLVLCPPGCDLEPDMPYFGRFVRDDLIPIAGSGGSGSGSGSGSSGSIGTGLPIFFVDCPGGSGSSSSGGGSGSTCLGCGWLLDWPAVGERCLELTITSTNGKCQCLDGGQTFKLFRRAGDGRWYGGMFETCCGCSVASFEVVDDAARPEVYGKLRLVKRNKVCNSPSEQTEYLLKNARCCTETGSILLDGANTRGVIDNCDGSVDPCSNYFTAKLRCIDCPPSLCCCAGCTTDCVGCLCQPPAPPAFYLDLSSAGFTGAGTVLNVPWVLTTVTGGSGSGSGCFWEGRCDATGTTINLLWVGQEPAGSGDSGVGWRLTMSVTGGTAIYETAYSEEGFACCTGFSLDKKSSSFGGPATVSLESLGAGDCEDCSGDPADRTFSVLLDANENCSCLDGVTVSLAYSIFSGTFKGSVGTDPCACSDHGSPLGPLTIEMPTDCSGLDIKCGECAVGLFFDEIVSRCPLVVTFGLMFTEHVGNCCAAGGPGTPKLVTATVMGI
jgi:hypothetical protein